MAEPTSHQASTTSAPTRGARRSRRFAPISPGSSGSRARGPLDVPIAVESWRQFQAQFGDFIGAGYLAYAVRGFFENGGRRCWIVRVASPDASTARR